jgi:hypothetical protein
MMSENTIFVVLLIGWTVALGVLGTLIVQWEVSCDGARRYLVTIVSAVG